MARSRIERIRERVRLGEYDMSAYATEEMAEDELTILDVESAILSGRIAQIQRDDPRGTRYLVEGVAADRRIAVAVVGRFAARRRYLIITVYRLQGKE